MTFLKKKSCVILIEKLLFIHVLKIYHCIKIDLWLTCIWFFCAVILLKSRQRQIKVEAPALLNKHTGSHSMSNLFGFYIANNFRIFFIHVLGEKLCIYGTWTMHMKFNEVLYKALIFDRLSKKYLIDFIKLVSKFKVPLIFFTRQTSFC